MYCLQCLVWPLPLHPLSIVWPIDPYSAESIHFLLVLECVKMMKTFFWGMLCCAQCCLFVDLLEFVFSTTFQWKLIIDKNFKTIKLWGMDISCMYESLVFYRWTFYADRDTRTSDLALELILLWYISCFLKGWQVFLVIAFVLCLILAWHHIKQQFLTTCIVICCSRKLVHTVIISTSDREVLCQQTLG